MGRAAKWILTPGAVAAGVMLMGAERAPPRLPPMPVPPVLHQAMPPYVARITISGDARMTGVFEECVDPAARLADAKARVKARPAGAPPPMTGCTTAREVRPGGSIHHEMSCDRAKGAEGTFRVVSDGTPDDLRLHVERYGAAKPVVTDSHLVRLGPCPPTSSQARYGGPADRSSTRPRRRLSSTARGGHRRRPASITGRARRFRKVG
jgi:hypothetical protein